MATVRFMARKEKPMTTPTIDEKALAEVVSDHYGGLYAKGEHAVAALVREIIEGYFAARAPLSALGAEPVAWQDAPSAPKDGAVLRLLVVPDAEAHTSFHDSSTPYETIGFNNFTDTGDDRWQFAGWDWSHDCITEGFGEVIGWLPFHAQPSPTISDEAVERQAREIMADYYRQFGNDGMAEDVVGDDWIARSSNGERGLIAAICRGLRAALEAGKV
jgi:hypothetical protein